MILLVSGATATLRRYAPHPHLGHLLTPANGNRLAALFATGLPLAVDNAAFSNWDEAAFLRLLHTLRPHRARVLWCAAPDVVADAGATLRRFGEWAGIIGWAGLPLAFVAQDGCEPVCGVPWGDIRCLFVGGSTAWKVGEDAARLITEAKRRGKLVHVGRCNSRRRLSRFHSLGADSVDGSGFSRFPDTHLPWALTYCATQQRTLF